MGYSEEDSYFLEDAYVGEGEVEFEIVVDGDVRNLRIDPAMDTCICKVREISVNGERIPYHNKKVFFINGKVAKGETPSLIFPTEDPNINIGFSNLQLIAKNVVFVKLEVVPLPMDIAIDMASAVKKLV